LGDFKFLYKTYADCASAELSTCLKLKLFTMLDRVARSLNDVKVTEGVQFTRDPEAPVDETPAKTEKEIEAELPRSLEAKNGQLNSLLFDKVMSFFQSHTLQVSISFKPLFALSIGLNTNCFPSNRSNSHRPKKCSAL
jgi:hypothetical protein